MENEKKYGSERERTFRTYNMHIYKDVEFSSDPWEMPIIKNDGYIPTDLISFNYALNSEPQKKAIHFYLDDYQFERLWNAPEKYTDVLKSFGCIISPDYSCYMDMKIPQQIFNVFRSRLIGAYYQSQGIKVIPNLTWSSSDSFDFCFRGVPKKSIVSVSTVGVARNKLSLWFFQRGIDELIRQIEPETILVYGSAADIDYHGVNIINFKNKNSNWGG